MKINWERGFARVWRFLLGIIWVLVLAWAGITFGAVGVGEWMVYMLVFSIFWLMLGKLMTWVVRGFAPD